MQAWNTLKATGTQHRKRAALYKTGKGIDMKAKMALMIMKHAHTETPLEAYAKTIFDEGDSDGNDGGTEGGTGDGDGDGDDKATDSNDDDGEKKYTDAEVNALLDKKFAQWKAKQEKAVDEAKRLEKMSADEKTAARLAELQKRLDEMEEKEARAKMAASARKLLQAENITVGDTIVNALIGENAETTKESVDAFVKAFKAAVKAEAKATFGKKEPKTSTGGTLTKEDILKIEDPIKQQEAIRKNMSLFR